MIRCKIINSGIQALVLTVFFFTSFTVKAQTITVGGSDWVITPPAITEAGNNYTAPPYQSATDQAIISMTYSCLLFLGGARISVHYVESPVWNSALTIETRRTTNGNTGYAPNPSGGTTYQQVTKIPTSFFTVGCPILGLGNVSRGNIHVQFQISGVSVTIPAENQQATVIFTIGAN